MCANAWRWWLGSFLLACAVLGVATCSGVPTTGDPTPTPTPQPTVIACTAAQSIQRFSVDPATVTEGDAFTLRWEAPCGYVTLAQKGKAQFVFNQPSTGSYQLRSGANGYPTGTGDTVYEAANGDLATRVYATVTVNARATPTPAPTPTPAAPPTPTPTPPATLTVTLSPAAGTTCHPTKKVSGAVVACQVPFVAGGTGYTSLAWSGCCAGSSGTTGNCSVNDITEFSCTATATGGGGSAMATATASGINAAPTIDPGSVCCTVGGGGCLAALPRNTELIDCSVNIADSDDAYETLGCEQITAGVCSPYFCGGSTIHAIFRFRVSTGDATGTCTVMARMTDPWTSSKQESWRLPVE
jgi:hypothetical protein